MDLNEAKASIAKCEQIVFNKASEKKPIEERIFNLEIQMFGMGRLGDCNSRLHVIQNALSTANGANQINSPSANASSETPEEKQLSSLEKRFYDKENFSRQAPEERLLRLEQQILGKEQTGDIQARLSALQNALNEKDELANKSAANGGASAATNFENLHHKSFQEAMDAGMANFKFKCYHHAQDDFEQALTFDPHSAQAYANLGTTLMTLKEELDAEEAFKACYALSPFGELGDYARTKILELACFNSLYNSGPYDTPQMAAMAQQIINRQAGELRVRNMQTAQVFARNRQILAAIEADKIAAQTRDTIASIRADSRYGYRSRSGYRVSGAFRDPYAEQEISDLGQIRSSYIITDGQVQANKALIEGIDKGASAFDSATSLKDQMMQPLRPGSVRMRALGTCLYVRYYGDGMPSRADAPPLIDPPLPELHATAELLPVKFSFLHKE